MTAITRRSSLLLLAALPVFSQTPAPSKAMTPDPEGQRPIAAADSVWIEDLTWMEIRDAMRGGKRTVIVATGGIEQNGPYLVLGKHNYILKATCEAIARKLGDALVAPIVPFVPEGDIDPPTGHMKYPGSISVTADTFERLLTDIAASFKTHGFERIIFLADSGGNVKGMESVAAKLAEKWQGKPKIFYVPEYYDYPGLQKYLETLGIRQTDEGIHDDYGISSILIATDPRYVRMEQRKAKGKLSINGVSLAPPKSVEIGRKAIAYRAQVAVDAIARRSR